MSEDTLEENARRYAKASSPPARTLRMSPKESAYLLVVLTDNAREWNAPLRAQLGQVVSNTEAYNARLELSGGR